MHETGIAMEVLRIARETAEREGAGRVLAVRLRVGRWSGVEAETLRFALETLADGPLLAGCRAEIEVVEPTFGCPACERTFEGTSYFDPCPHCGAAGGQLLEGDEMTVTEIEVDDR